MILNDSVMEAAAYFDDPSERAAFIAACCDFVFSGTEPEGMGAMVMSNFASQRHSLANTRAKMANGAKRRTARAGDAGANAEQDASEPRANREQARSKAEANAEQTESKAEANAEQTGSKAGTNSEQARSKPEAKRDCVKQGQAQGQEKNTPPIPDPDVAGGRARSPDADPISLLDRRGSRP